MLAFAIEFSLIVMFYGSIHIQLNSRTVDLSGDIEKNLEHRPSSSPNLSICLWKLNSITAHSYVKMSFLKAFSQFINLMQCVSQKNTSTLVLLYMMSVWKYMNYQTTHRNINGVVYLCIYFRNSLPLKNTKYSLLTRKSKSCIKSLF